MKENNFISEEVKDLSPFFVSMKKKSIFYLRELLSKVLNQDLFTHL